MRASSSWRAVGLGLGLLVAMAGAVWVWRMPLSSPAPPDLRGANVLLVTIDTLRADRVGVYGSSAGLTPGLDALANRGVRFTQVWSHAPMTLPSHASILTGLLPTHHGVRNNSAFRLGPEPTTLAERFRASGYRTGAFVGAFVLDARFGLNRGFDEYDDRYDTAAAHASFHFVERPADRVLQAATTWISSPASGDARPWFAWVHLFDPHAPYQAPSAFTSDRAPYDAEVAWTDSALGSALNDLGRLGQMDRTLLVVTADHGESLGDHGETTHGLFAYEATMRVPLIVSAPGLEPREVSSPTGHIDIAPTILDLVGVTPPMPLDGRSRRAAILGASSDVGPIYFEALDANLTRGWAPLTGLILGRWKYIDLPEPELYDLDADPSERTNLVARERHSVEELQARLRASSTPPPTATRSLDAATTARLQSLGYVTGSAKPRTTFTVADDPKRLIALSEQFNAALEDFNSGRSDAALQKLSEILVRRPDFLAARLSAATVLIGAERGADAIRLLDDGPVDDKTSPAWLTKMGQALASAGNLRKAKEVLGVAVTASSGDTEPLNDLGLVLLRLKEHDEARRTFERLLVVDPTAAGTLYNLGLLEMSVRRRPAATAAFRRVVDLDPRHVDAWRGLGAALVADDAAEAVEAWRRVVELAPQDFDTLYNLGLLLNEEGRSAEALPYLQRFLAEAPRERYANDFPRVRALVARAKTRP